VTPQFDSQAYRPPDAQTKQSSPGEQRIRDSFFQSRSATEALEGRTALVDQLVRERWTWMPKNIALAAVGGYGRKELFPFSDIDLLILTPDEKAQAAIKEPLSMCLRDLWDKGLRISQSVHTPADCNHIDSGNAELAVSLLDRRFLAGDESLFHQIRDPRPDLGKNIAQLTKERHTRFQDTIYHLEPNVKDAPGGLRDLQVLRWLAKLGEAEGENPAGTERLFQIRCFLHYLAGRDDNKLSFERQDEIAELSGSPSPEHLMREYYRAARDIARIANRRLEAFEARRSTLFSQFRDRSSRLSNPDFTVLHGEVFLRSPTAIQNDPAVELRLFQFIAHHDLPLAANTARRLDEGKGNFEAWARSQAALWPQVRDVLKEPHAARALRAMHDCGALQAIFPELREIDALVIRDFYHRYTVDEHTLVAIQSIFDLRGKPGDSFGDLAVEADEIDLLTMALLFHDVGKGTPGEGHVTASVRVARGALLRVGMTEREWETVAFLIGAHLDMSSVMNGRDLSDPLTIRDMAAKAGTIERLKLLTLLTCADIGAVNPSALTPWRKQLLWNLYSATYSELTRELSARIKQPEREVNPSLRQFLEGLPPRYLRTHTEDEIAEHLRLEREGGHRGVHVSLKKSAAWVLTIVAGDRPYLFSATAAAISSFGFNILKVEAFSNARGTVIDTFTFADPARTLELNPSEKDDVVRTVTRAIRGEIALDVLLKRRPKVKPDAHAMAASRVSVDNQASPAATLIEMTAQDRPGLLYDVSSVISRRGVNIEVVLVDTEAKKAIDVFYVTRLGKKLGDEEAKDLADAISAVTRPPI